VTKDEKYFILSVSVPNSAFRSLNMEVRTLVDAVRFCVRLKIGCLAGVIGVLDLGGF
jgi:hypothetical protein